MTQHSDRVTQAAHALTVPPHQAEEVAQHAADRAAVAVDEVHDPAALKRIELLFAEVWQTGPDRPPVTSDVLRALTHAGSYVVTATNADGQIAGACVGFLATDVGDDGHGTVVGADGVATGWAAIGSLHSHIAAVAPGMERRGIGSALKLHQRAWAIRRGLASITWTFDPLLRRNAAFNAHLGAQFVAYYPDFYGEMADGRNAGHGSDRLLARWPLTAGARSCTAPDPGPDEPVLLDSDGGKPLPGPGPAGAHAWVTTPADIESIRLADPPLARRWRLALREAMYPLMSGRRVAGFSASGRYLLVPNTERPEKESG